MRKALPLASRMEPVPTDNHWHFVAEVL